MTNRKNWKTGYSMGNCTEWHFMKAGNAKLDCIEVWAMDEDGPVQWDKIPQWEAQSGVKAWSFHLPFYFEDERGCLDPATFDEKEWQKVLDIDVPLIEGCGRVGIKYLVIHPSMEGYDPAEREARMEASIKHLSQLSDIAKANGCILCVENLPRTCLGNTSDEMLRFMEANPDFRMCFDSNHLMHEGHRDFIRKVGKYIVTTHISDYDVIKERHWFPLEGTIDWKEVQSALEEVDYDGPFIYEAWSEGKDCEDIPANHEILKNL